MGIELVKVASTRLGFLGGRPFKVLIAMASTALDKPNAKGQPANLYWAGWEPLAMALGFSVPPEPPRDHPDRERVLRRRKKLASAVSAALTNLETGTPHRLITRLEDHPGTGTRQTIELHPDVWLKVDHRDPIPGDQSDPIPGDQSDPIPGDQSDPHSGIYRTPKPGEPRKHLGRREDLSQDISHPVADLSTDRARSPRAMDAHTFEDDQTQHHDCAVCTYPRSHPSHRSAA